MDIKVRVPMALARTIVSYQARPFPRSWGNLCSEPYTEEKEGENTRASMVTTAIALQQGWIFF